MKVCLHCQLEFEDKFLFCHQCGGKLQSKVEQNFCPFCGNRIETDGGFCPFCGNSLEKIESVDSNSNTVIDNSLNTRNEPLFSKNKENNTATIEQTVYNVKDSKEPFFSKQHLFSYEGRRGRLSYVAVQTFWGIISEILMFLTLGNLALILVVELVLAYPRVCNIAKRIHDLNKPTSWAVMLFILGDVASIVVHSTGYLALTDKSVLYGRLIIALIVCIPFCVLFFKKGTDGPNQYGDDPL